MTFNPVSPMLDTVATGIWSHPIHHPFFAHMLELKKNFSNKLDQLKRSRFLPRKVLLTIRFYFSVILPSVKYGIVLWGSCTNSDLVNSVNSVHCRAARIIFNLPRDMPSTEVLTCAQWQGRQFSTGVEGG